MKTIAAAAVAAGITLATLPVVTAEAADSGKSAGDFMFRVRGLAVLPDEGSSVTPIGGKVDGTNEVVPEVDLSYFFADQFAVELIAATTRHHMRDNGSTLGNVDLGKVSLLPPTLTLQWHPLPKNRFSPYIGAGVNYTHFYHESAPGGTVTSIHYSDSWGFAAQAGIDYAITDRWYLNADVKKIFINTDVTINGGAVRANVDIDPWVVGVGVGYRF